MKIAGIEPAGHLANTIGDLKSGTDMYADYQVRDILIKFANSKNAMRRDMEAERIVDKFMESGGE